MTEVGHLDQEVPRDRVGTFEPQTVRKGQWRLEVREWQSRPLDRARCPTCD